ncbi:MAG: DNA methyltransferase [Xanthomonadaceae bacterium]|nr:DNA methyltransferase [Xanthomonadaceae bacterium]
MSRREKGPKPAGLRYSANQVNECIWLYKTGGMPEKLGFGRKHDTIHFVSKNRANTIWNTQKEKSYLAHNYGFSNIELFTDDVGTYSLVNLRDVWDIAALRGNQPEKVDYPTQKPEALLERIIKASSNEGDLVADFFCGSGTTAAVAEKLNRKWIATDLGKFGIYTTRKRLIGVQRELKTAEKNFRAFEVLNLGRYQREAYLGVHFALDRHSRASGNPEGAAETLDARVRGHDGEVLTRAAQQRRNIEQKEREFRELILRAYKAEAFDNDSFFHGKHGGRLVVIGPINLPVGRLFVEEVITECRKRGASRVDMLAFEFEMGLFPAVLEEAKGKGIDLTPKYIPAEVFDKRAVDKGQVVFHDISFVEATPRYDGKDKLAVQIELTDFSVYYNQGAADAAIAAIKDGKASVICDAGQLVKIGKSKDGVITRKVLTKHWTDWVDYWAVDFDYMSRREIIKVPVDFDFASPAGRGRRAEGAAGEGSGGAEPRNDTEPSSGPSGHLLMELPANRLGGKAAKSLLVPAGEGKTQGEFEERWTGGYIFENEWQSFRTRKKRELDLTTALHRYDRPGRYTVAVKVIDIFGNDTMSLVPVTVG